MPLKIHPKIGTVVRCDYSSGFSPPEMIKRRPVIIISPRLRRRDGLCTVVPMSQTEPQVEMPYNCRLEFEPPLPYPYDNPVQWVKADMLATVGFHRLQLLFREKDQYGKRKYDTRIISADDLERVRACVREALGLAMPAA